MYGADNIPIELSGRYDLGHRVPLCREPYTMAECMIEWNLADVIPAAQTLTQAQTVMASGEQLPPSRPQQPPRVSNIHSLLNPVGTANTGNAGVQQATVIQQQQPAARQVGNFQSHMHGDYADAQQDTMSPEQQRASQVSLARSNMRSEPTEVQQYLPSQDGAPQPGLPRVGSHRTQTRGEDTEVQPFSPSCDGIAERPRALQVGLAMLDMRGDDTMALETRTPRHSILAGQGPPRASQSSIPSSSRHAEAAEVQQAPASHRNTTQRPRVSPGSAPRLPTHADNTEPRRSPRIPHRPSGRRLSRVRRTSRHVEPRPRRGTSSRERPRTRWTSRRRRDGHGEGTEVQQLPPTTSPHAHAEDPGVRQPSNPPSDQPQAKEQKPAGAGIITPLEEDTSGLQILAQAAEQVEGEETRARESHGSEEAEDNTEDVKEKEEKAVEAAEEQTESVETEASVPVLAPAAHPAPGSTYHGVWIPQYYGDSWAPQGVPEPEPEPEPEGDESLRHT